MGEPIVESPSPNLEDKTGETAASNPELEVSVSFGRFENDSLSWEKWSSFSPNKYLEEVEKCATRGSVAKKAAYFEAHYKKIAARKVDLLDQEKQMSNDSSGVNNQTCGDLIGDNCKIISESDISDCQRSDGVVNQDTSLDYEVSQTLADVPNGDAAKITVGCQSSSIEGMKEEVEARIASTMLEKPEEAVSVSAKEETENASLRMEDVKESQEKEMGHTASVQEEKLKLDRPKDSHKLAQAKKERSTSRIKMKPVSPIAKASPITTASPITKASPIAKAPQLSTPRVSKPTSTPISSSRSSMKTRNGSSLLRNRNSSSGESKKVAPKSLHMSLSLGPSSSDDPPSLTPTRKSLIMEKMGDKDIVKRAFKTFQNSYNQLRSPGEERPSESKQVPAKVAEPRVSTLMTPRKENAGSFKSAAVEKKYGKAALPSLPLKSDEREEKKGEFSKKLEEKSSARDAERPCLQTKSKEDKEAEIRRERQSIDSKAILTPALYRGQKISKNSLNKEGSKNEMQR